MVEVLGSGLFLCGTPLMTVVARGYLLVWLTLSQRCLQPEALPTPASFLPPLLAQVPGVTVAGVSPCLLLPFLPCHLKAFTQANLFHF